MCVFFCFFFFVCFRFVFVISVFIDFADYVDRIFSRFSGDFFNILSFRCDIIRFFFLFVFDSIYMYISGSKLYRYLRKIRIAKCYEKSTAFT